MREQDALTGWIYGMLSAEANQSTALQSCVEWCHCETEGEGGAAGSPLMIQTLLVRFDANRKPCLEMSLSFVFNTALLFILLHTILLYASFFIMSNCSGLPE